MGADLYIEPYYTENKDKYQPIFDEACKTRDAYAKGIPEAVYNAVRAEEFGLDLTPEQLAKKEVYATEYNKYKELQAKVDEAMEKMYEVGYFRDSYNGSSLFWKLGLSWWAMANVHGENKKVQLINSRGYITPKKAVMLLALVEALPITIGDAEIKQWAPGTTREDLVKYFTEKKARFIAFIKFAIEKKKSIMASV
jgi:hypothetical protein